jgi:hypothetical protein
MPVARRALFLKLLLTGCHKNPMLYSMIRPWEVSTWLVTLFLSDLSPRAEKKYKSLEGIAISPCG